MGSWLPLSWAIASEKAEAKRHRDEQSTANGDTPPQSGLNSERADSHQDQRKHDKSDADCDPSSQGETEEDSRSLAEKFSDAVTGPFDSAYWSVV